MVILNIKVKNPNYISKHFQNELGETRNLNNKKKISTIFESMMRVVGRYHYWDDLVIHATKQK